MAGLYGSEPSPCSQECEVGTRVVKLFTSRTKAGQGWAREGRSICSVMVGDVRGGAGTAGLFRPRVLGPGLFVTSSDLFFGGRLQHCLLAVQVNSSIWLAPAHANDITLDCNVPSVHVLQNCSPQG